MMDVFNDVLHLNRFEFTYVYLSPDFIRISSFILMSDQQLRLGSSFPHDATVSSCRAALGAQHTLAAQQSTSDSELIVDLTLSSMASRLYVTLQLSFFFARTYRQDLRFFFNVLNR